MAQFYPLRVADIRRDTRDSIVVTLEPNNGDVARFKFIPGQYLTFRHEFDGEELRRNYSICAGKDDGVLRIGVKRVDGGCFSNWANDNLSVGDLLDAMPPAGRFCAPIEPEKSKSYFGFAGGSGITPFISIIKSVLAAEPNSEFTLVYGNRSLSAVMFREELEDLKNRYLGRFSIVHVLETDAEEIELFTGRLDRAKCDALFDSWLRVDDADLAFICGPEPMMDAVSEALTARGVDESRIKIERFGAPQQGRATTSAARVADPTAHAAKATIILDGAAHEIDVAPGQTVLEAARAANLDAPYSCTKGVCSTCRARIVKGEVEMAANYALEDYEVKAGYVLSCQSRPISNTVVVDYDQ